MSALDKIFGGKISATVVVNSDNVGIKRMEKAVDKNNWRFYIRNERNELFAFNGVEHKYSRKSDPSGIFQRVAFHGRVVITQRDHSAHSLTGKALTYAVNKAENYWIVKLSRNDQDG